MPRVRKDAQTSQESPAATTAGGGAPPVRGIRSTVPARKKSKRGPYRNGQERRDELVTAARDLFAEHGFQRLSFRAVAEALGTSHAALSYHFLTKEDLLTAVFEQQAQHDQPFLQEGLVNRGLLDLAPDATRRSTDEPEFIRLDSTLLAEALRPDHPAHDHMHGRVDAFVGVIRAQLEEEQDRGRLRHGLDLDVAARLFVAVTYGLNLQWLYDTDVTMDEHIRAFVDLLRPVPDRVEVHEQVQPIKGR